METEDTGNHPKKKTHEALRPSWNRLRSLTEIEKKTAIDVPRKLPADIWVRIFLELEISDMLSVARVCSIFYALSRQIIIIKALDISLAVDSDAEDEEEETKPIHLSQGRTLARHYSLVTGVDLMGQIQNRQEMSALRFVRDDGHEVNSIHQISCSTNSLPTSSPIRSWKAANRESVERQRRLIDRISILSKSLSLNDANSEEVKLQLRKDSNTAKIRILAMRNNLIKCANRGEEFADHILNKPRSATLATETNIATMGFQKDMKPYVAKETIEENAGYHTIRKARGKPILEQDDAQENTRKKSVPNSPDLLGTRRRLTEEKKIKRTLREYAVALDLSEMEIGTLRPSHVQIISRLGGIEELWLSENNLETLPQTFRNLDSLIVLKLARNLFSEIPVEVVMLKNLQYLDLSNNKLKTITPKIGFIVQLRCLLLESNELDSLPFSLGELDNLEVLILNNNRFNQIPPCVCQLLSLKELDFRNNMLISVTAKIAKMKTLEKLDLRDNQICLLPDFPSHMTVATSGNRFLSTEEEMKRLKESTELSLSHLEIPVFPDVILQFQQLTTLNLSANELLDIPFEFRNLVSITNLDLSSNRFEFIPLSVGLLPKLLELNMSKNRMKVLRIAPAPGDKGYLLFQSLRRMDVSKNQILDILIDMDITFGKLEMLSLSENNLTSLDAVSLPPLLRVLDLQANEICQLNEIEFPRGLQGLYLQSNRLSALPVSLGRCLSLVDLKVENNPLETIPAMLHSDNKQILKYLSKMKEEYKVEVRIKLLVLGDLNVGKSSLLRSFKGKGGDKVIKHKEGSEGFTILNWLPSDFEEELIFTTWEFNHEDIYYFAHQFFMSSRSIYLVVFSIADAIDLKRISFWLNCIQRRCPGGKVFLVATHWDKRLQTEILFKLDVAINQLAAKLKNDHGEAGLDIQKCCFNAKYTEGMLNESIPLENLMLSFWPVSSTKAIGTSSLRNRLIEVGLCIPRIKVQIPLSYENMLQMVEQKRKETVYIDWKTMVVWGQGFGMDEQAVKKACQLWTDMGEVVYFNKQVSSSLGDIVLLDVMLICNVLSSLIGHSDGGNAKKGIISATTLTSIWNKKGVPATLYHYMFEYLQRFDVILLLPEQQTVYDTSESNLAPELSISPQIKQAKYLVPSLLPHQRPSTAITPYDFRPKMLCRSYQFPYLPRGFLAFLTARLLQFSTAEELWSSGAIVRVLEEIALVEVIEDVSTSILIINAYSSTEETPSTLFRLIICSLENFCNDWHSKLRFDTVVTAPCASCFSKKLGNKSYSFDTEECIQKFMVENIAEISCPSCEETIAIEKLIPELRHPFAGVVRDNIPEQYLVPKTYETLGEGSYAVVRRGKFKIFGRPIFDVAVKELRPYMINLPTLVEFQNEVNILRQADHAGIVKLYYAFCRPPSIITEHVSHGSLEKYIYNKDCTDNNSLSWLFKLRVAQDIAHALNFLHTRRTPILHRDIKSANVLVYDLDPQAPTVVKLCDLGLSCVSSGFDSRGKNDNPRWTAVEVLQGQPYTIYSDIYSYAILLYELVTGKVPFGDDNFEFIVEQRIIRGDRPTIPDSVPEGFANIIRACWNQIPSERPTMEKVIPKLGALVDVERKRLNNEKRWTSAIPLNLGKSRTSSLDFVESTPKRPFSASISRESQSGIQHLNIITDEIKFTVRKPTALSMSSNAVENSISPLSENQIIPPKSPNVRLGGSRLARSSDGNDDSKSGIVLKEALNAGVVDAVTLSSGTIDTHNPNLLSQPKENDMPKRRPKSSTTVTPKLGRRNATQENNNEIRQSVVNLPPPSW